MNKYLPLVLVLASVSNPKSIHYSSNGNYLVNENGQKTTIQGHPEMVCYRPHGELHGTFDKVRGSTIWITATEWNGRQIDNWYVEIKNPVCDLK